MNPKNRTIILYQVILFLFFNVLLIFALNYLTGHIPVIFRDTGLRVVPGLILFWILLFLLNWKMVIPLLRGRIRKIIRKQLLRNKKRRRLNKYLLFALVVFGLFFFRIWNVDLILRHNTNPLQNIVGFRAEKLPAIEFVDYSGIRSIQVDQEQLGRNNYSSDYGRYLRTYRWSPFIEKAEKSYGIEEGLLAGLIMQESYGNPLQLNALNDGGAGLMMFQPGTAREYGLKTYGNSAATGRDTNHGLNLKRLVERNDYNYEKLSDLDERFHVAKSIDAGARFLSGLYRKHNSWDKAVSAYNRGTPAFVPASTAHVRRVRYFQQCYLTYNRETIK